MREFFHALYGRYEPEGDAWFAVGPKAGPYEFVHLSDLPDWVFNDNDAYFRLCPMAEKPPSHHKRGTADKSCAVMFVWADIDCGEKDNKKHYFPSIEEAVKWVKQYLPWSVIVMSGTGIHVYCVLDAPIFIENAADLNRARLLCFRFQQYIRETSGYEIDSTHDLARVLRAPGSINTSCQNKVEVIELRDAVIEEEVIAGLPVTKTAPAVVSSQQDLDFRLDPNCKIDINFLFQLFQINPTLSEAWSGKRELPGSDHSPSAYRFSMLSFLMHAGLDKQDVVDITIRYLLDQRKYSVDQIKLDRPEVWASEMAKCKVTEMTYDDIQVMIEKSSKDEQLSAVGSLMEFPDPSKLVGISKFDIMSSDDTLDDVILQLHVEVDGKMVKVRLPNPTSRPDSRKVLFNMTGIFLPHYSGKRAAEANRKWEGAMSLAWHAASVEDAVTTDSAACLLHAIKSFAGSGEMAQDLEQAKSTGRPCIDAGFYVIPTNSLNSLAMTMYPSLRSSKELHRAVKELGEVGVTKVQQVYRGVRMACLLVPQALIEEV